MTQISKSLRFQILTRDGYRCRYCGASAEMTVLHIDHVVPKAKGGRDDAANLVTACADCNLGKSDRKIVGIPAGFALTPDMRPHRLAKMRRGDEIRATEAERAQNDKHWIPGGVIDVLDQANSDTLCLLFCETHQCNEAHWIDDFTAESIEAWGAEAGWLRGVPWRSYSVKGRV